MRLIRWLAVPTLLLAMIGLADAPLCHATTVSVGAPLDWRVFDTAEIANGYAGVMLVTDWDRDGADEVLVPRWGGASYKDQAMIDRRSDLIELDGTITPTGLLGEPLAYSTAVWDYTGDGIPEIVCDDRMRGGYAYEEWYSKKLAEREKEMEKRLAPLRKRQQAIADEIARLRQQGGNAQRLGELAAEDDAIYKQIDEIRFGDEFKIDPAEEKRAGGFFVRNDTSIYNLAGDEIAQLPGRRLRGSQHLLGCFTSDKLQLLLGPQYYSREVEPSRKGGQHKLFNTGGKRAAIWTVLANVNYMAAGDLDGDGRDEIVGQRLGLAPYAFPLSELVMLDPKHPDKLQVLGRSAIDTPGAWPVACLDWTGDGCAEILLANGAVLDHTNGQSWQLDHPPFANAAFLSNAPSPSVVLCDLDGLAQPEMWAVINRSQLASFKLDGSLIHYEDMDERIRQLAAATDGDGQQYLIVQLKSRILIWRVEPQAGPGSTMA